MSSKRVSPAPLHFSLRGTATLPSRAAAYVHLCQHIKETYPKFSYVHFVEDSGAWMGKEILHPRSNDIFRSVFREPTGSEELGHSYSDPNEQSPTVFISAGDYKTESSIKVSGLKGDIIAIGRSYISNPDLPARVKNGWEWTPTTEIHSIHRSRMRGIWIMLSMGREVMEKKLLRRKSRKSLNGRTCREAIVIDTIEHRARLCSHTSSV